MVRPTTPINTEHGNGLCNVSLISLTSSEGGVEKASATQAKELAGEAPHLSACFY